ncbi:O-antigen ligase family protein [Qipengyuania soli]|uniref:O-antigen ligase family protein n=1 Tax=Qipengyuania soli TaxID=2782568 RepID=A0A7S8IVT0_9SPHN|nr:O-antigen ligase family protein [Qipengyuania soli]
MPVLDLALFLTVMLLFAMGLRRPFIWVLTYLYIDILAPQKISWALLASVPISLIAFILAFAGWIIGDTKANTQFTLRQGLLLALLCWCFMTLQWADYPEFAQEKWNWVWKALVFAIFLPVTLTTRLRFEMTSLIMVLTAGAIIISASMKTVLGGGGYGNLSLFVNDNSNVYESSTLATIAIAIIPLILWLVKNSTVFPTDWRVKAFAGLLIFACLMIPVGTEARTGLICIGVLGLLMLRDVKKRMLYVTGAAALGLAALPFLPASFYERMSTLNSVEEDQSASTRMQVWAWTIDYAAEHPLGGGFDAFRGNSFTYQMPVVERNGSTVSVRYEQVTDGGRAYHSSIFEMLGEQGWPGLLAWLALHAIGIWQMEVIRRRWRDRRAPTEQWQSPLASALQFAQIIYLVGATFQGIAFQPFVLMLVGMQIGLWTYCKKRESAKQESVRKAARDARRAAASAKPAMP